MPWVTCAQAGCTTTSTGDVVWPRSRLDVPSSTAAEQMWRGLLLVSPCVASAHNCDSQTLGPDAELHAGLSNVRCTPPPPPPPPPHTASSGAVSRRSLWQLGQRAARRRLSLLLWPPSHHRCLVTSCPRQTRHRHPRLDSLSSRTQTAWRDVPPMPAQAPAPQKGAARLILCCVAHLIAA